MSFPESTVSTIQQENIFSSLDFDSLPWAETESGERKASVNISLESETFVLSAIHMPASPAERLDETYFFSLRPIDGEEVISVRLIIQPNSMGTENRLIDTIMRHDRESRILPRKSGMAFYRKVLDFIEQMPKIKPLTHYVVALPSDGNLAIWSARFTPDLVGRGYREEKEGTWSKKYPANIQ